METKSKEIDLQKAVCKWLKACHPGIVFVSITNDVYKYTDIQDGRSHPDLIIQEPAGEFHGLNIEFKREKSMIYNKDGGYKQNSHLKDQIKCMVELLSKNYMAAFVWDFKQGVTLIENYLKEKENK